MDFVTTFVKGCWKVTKVAMVIARGSKMGTLYMTANDKDRVAVVNSTKDSKIWHCRLGHMSEKGMKIMAAKEKLDDLKSINSGLCEDCIMGKQKRLPSLRLEEVLSQESWNLYILMCGDQPLFGPLVAHSTMSPSLMTPQGRYGFIF